MLAILLTLIFIRPFISSLAFPYENLIYSELLLIVLIVWIIGKRVLLPQLPSIKYALLLFILAIVVSFIFSKDKLTSLKELYKYLTAILLFITIASLSPLDKNRVILCILIAGCLISLACIYQYAFGFQHLLKNITAQRISDAFILDYIGRRRPFFPFVTPNILAGYLAMIVPLTLYHRKRIWFILPLSFALLLTKSLGALLSIFFALIIYFYLEGNLKKIGLSFLAGLLIIIGFVFFTRAAMPKQHIQPIFSAVMRLNYWQDTLKIIMAHPLAGVGLGNFNLAYSRYTHNSYLQIWAEMGIFGMVSILWLVIAVLKSGFKTFKDSPYKTQIAGLITANIVFLIHNLVDFTFFLPEVSLIWWVILGITLRHAT
jgi:putative inorganic carbon (HCO3(-)) transporter